MNKLTIILLSIITLGLIATPALAADRLSNANFFYGEAVSNPIESANQVAVTQTEDVQNPPAALAASNFFYGDTIPNHVDVTVNHDQNMPNALALPNQLDPQMFYGYVHANTVVNPCSCATCTNC